MLPEAGAFELIFLGAVALIVVGPKDLPVLLRKLGQFLARIRGMAAEFRASFDEMARQSELDELRREVEALRNMRFSEPLAPELNRQIEEVNRDLTTQLSHGGAAAAPEKTAEPEA
jgi:sec-independent protein translocase protein TatB